MHATRTLEPGPSVAIIDAETMRHRLACSLPDDAEVDVRLVYLAPSLRNALNGAPYWRPSEIIPWYAVTVTRTVIHPGRRTGQPLTSRVRLIPATDDTRFVPSVSRRGEQPSRAPASWRAQQRPVARHPYSFLWAGSNPDTSYGARRGGELRAADARPARDPPCAVLARGSSTYRSRWSTPTACRHRPTPRCRSRPGRRRTRTTPSPTGARAPTTRARGPGTASPGRTR